MIKLKVLAIFNFIIELSLLLFLIFGWTFLINSGGWKNLIIFIWFTIFLSSAFLIWIIYSIFLVVANKQFSLSESLLIIFAPYILAWRKNKENIAKLNRNKKFWIWILIFIVVFNLTIPLLSLIFDRTISNLTTPFILITLPSLLSLLPFVFLDFFSIKK
ncbi:hypothetical protein [Mesomycoplasma molare]|uniref:Uncharacterized protein n=1 Tax=Mesomycoplasma molare TaxID=171288 RepID=A0ABY5TU13_9BACT|nr:hypothetical protein [Mesomycoplasma molare]UWD34157.1 hypothetical protein NX772_03680 [Mesomycoplasma molare]